MNQQRDIVVIGASAGGVEALIGLFQNLPQDLAAAIFVVLHVPADGPSQLQRILGRETTLPVAFALEGEQIQSGRVYVAAPDRHLTVQGKTIRLTRGPKESRARPSIDVLFRSAALSFGPRVIAVVLSGALDDGTAGSWAVKDRGGLVLVQDPAEAMHSSMPESTIQHVEIDNVATVRNLAHIVAGLVGAPVDPSTSSSSEERHAVENLIAMEGNGLREGVMELGKVSRYTCPDCHGVLVQIEEGTIVRFRCHTGHSFSMKALLVEVDESIDKGLWDTLRAIEERIMLLRQMSAVAYESGASGEAEFCLRQAEDSEERIKPLRELVLDPGFFGHNPLNEE
jgi:two-component system chemotaxis response regulator CheB